MSPVIEDEQTSSVTVGILPCRTRLPNLGSLFTHTTPCVTTFHSPKVDSCSREEKKNLSEKLRRKSIHERGDFFNLQDLWECYEEPSAYGAEVPLVMESGEEVLQYYVPYLSAIQLFSRPPKNEREQRCIHVGSSSEDGDCDSAYGDCDRISGRFTESSCDTDSVDSRSDDGVESTYSKKQAVEPSLLFEYFESAMPFTRSPLADKVSELSRDYPDLVRLTSSQLAPSSWLAVAWYPIYRIPTGKSLKDLAACFLTYHCLNLQQQEEDGLEVDGCPMPPQNTSRAEKAALDARVARVSSSCSGAALRPFGYAAYKVRGEIWNSTSGVMQMHETMLESAKSW
eukprot:CAMPEP_0196591058 /NCGR_PEP_ID=MMETSP1081-20130531/68399_1 /TAXON_ID=36882 /ORGANISM="Pyramimonas amylifera, Strain CCMP720" /LENGTH=340 /DNA_ID=CAMNT_0041914315 /DNA_START=121 /DNA_END=1140 /DNA_ORIENTATION=-